MTTYYFNLQNLDLTQPYVHQMIQVGTISLNFEFQWDEATYDQYTLLIDYITRLADTDPLYVGGEIVRDYDWLDYYTSLSDTDISTWLESNPDLPFSIRNFNTARKITYIKNNIVLATSIQSMINEYFETARWQCTVTPMGDSSLGVSTCFVEPGGWLRIQDRYYSFRFMSNLTYIGREDLNKVVIVFEVQDE